MSSPITILIVADGNTATTHTNPLASAWQGMGHTVHTFHWQGFFYNYPYRNPATFTPLQKLANVYYRAQNKFLIGPAMVALNRALLKTVAETKPNMLFIQRGTHIWPSTLAKLRRQGITLMGYNNDDPFSPHYPAYVWRHFLAGLPHYHHLFAYRPKNVADYQSRGLPTSLLRSFYLPEHNHPITPKPTNTPYACDVIFIGHYEPDGRDDTLKLLIQSGINLKLYGTLWEQSPHHTLFCKHMGGPIQRLGGPDYNLALNSARMALVFLSHLNNDTYTRRCFEIPATATPMLAPTNNDLTTLFTPNTEALFYTSPTHLVQQIQTALANPNKLEKIGQAGHQRLLQSGHTPHHRAMQILETYQGLCRKT